MGVVEVEGVGGSAAIVMPNVQRWVISARAHEHHNYSTSKRQKMSRGHQNGGGGGGGGPEQGVCV